MFKLAVHGVRVPRPAWRRFPVLRLEGFGYVTVRAKLHGLHGSFNGAHPGHDHKGQHTVHGTHPLEQLNAADIRHGKIAEHQIVGTLSHGTPCRFSRKGCLHVPPLAGEQQREDIQPFRLVIHNQNAVLHMSFRAPVEAVSTLR